LRRQRRRVMSDLSEKELIFDWNLHHAVPISKGQQIEFDDETLRDGIQSPSVLDPDIEVKIRILHLMEELGIQGADIGLPGAGPRAVEDVFRLAKEIVDSGLKIQPNCAARTVRADIQPVIDISHRIGRPIEVSTFLGSSPIRQYAEDWDLARLLKHTEDSVKFAVDNGLSVMYVTEDTTRARPEVIKKLYTTAIECGARRICLADTVGHATPHGAMQLVSFAREIVADTGEPVKIDWHGHRDRGLSVPNSLAAIAAGAHRVHGCALGIGERVGNAPMDLLLVNLKLMGLIQNDLRLLPEYCNLVSRACGVPIPPNYPVFGADAFRTGTGVHAAAVIKAFSKGHDWLANRIYSGVPAEDFGMEQKIEVGHMSGRSNVIFWLEKRGFEATDDLVDAIFAKAKSVNRLLTDDEIMRVITQRRA
jgi:isopropylmalate/homocitrate/citramalate synthase